MVFESIVTDLLNRFIGDYVENLDSKQLKIGIWGGDVVLHDLVLKQSALSELDLPVQTVYGRLEKLVIKIPWQNLYYSSVEANIDGLYLLVEPNLQVKYNAEKEEKKAFDYKQSELLRIENAKKELERGKKKVDDTFVEKLATQIIKNVQVSIKNIHVRYEDKVTNPGHPFSLGVTLGNLSLYTTDDEWTQTIVYDTVCKIFKVVELEGLAIYWNCESTMYRDLSKVDLVYRLQDEIANKSKQVEHYSYILGPISSSTRLQLNPKPQHDVPAFSTPKAIINLEMEKLAVVMTKRQYQNIIAFADSLDLMMKGSIYRQYRPDVPSYRGYYKEWWQFAYKCILVHEVRRVRNNWKWDCMKSHRDQCKKYRKVYQTKLQTKKCPLEIEEQVLEYEQKLDLLNIVLIRQQVQMDLERLGKIQEQKRKKQSWFGGWWSRTKEEESPAVSPDDSEASTVEQAIDLVSQFQAVMTPEEKARLFKAIDYNENALPDEYPEAFVDVSCTFVLHVLEIELFDETFALISVLNSSLQSVKCKLERRPANSGLSVFVNIDHLSVYGVQQEEILPQIMTSKTGDDNALLDVLFELNPLHTSYGQRLHVSVKPLRVIYDAVTVNKIVDVFRVPQSSTLVQLSEATTNTINDVKEKSTAGVQHAIDSHSQLDLKVDMYAPYIVLPYGGLYTETENVLVVNLGHLNITSQNRPKTDIRQKQASSQEQNEIIKAVLEESYDTFVLEFTELQVLLVPGGENWIQYINECTHTDLHLLSPMSLSLKFHKCLIENDHRLPLTKISGKLPSISVTVIDSRLALLLSLVYSIPLPKKDEFEITLTDTTETNRSTTLVRYLEYQEMAAKSVKDLETEYKNENSEFIQFTKLKLDFVMEEMSVTLGHQECSYSTVEKVAVFSINTLGCGLNLQTHMTQVTLHLGFIDFHKFHNDSTVEILSTPLGHMQKSHLFMMQFTQISRLSPEFHTKYNSCESLLNLDFAVLNVVLHQQVLEELFKYAADIQKLLEDIISAPLNVDRLASASTTTIRRRLSTLSEGMSMASLTPFKVLEKPKKSTMSVNESVMFKVKASLTELLVIFKNDRTDIASCSIGGITSDIQLKKSYTQVTAKLVSMLVQDLNPNSFYPKLLHVVDEEAVNIQLIKYNKEFYDTSQEDLQVTAMLGGLKIVFLNVFIKSILDFTNEFQMAQAAILEASLAAAEQAKHNMTRAYENAVLIKINVNFKAPDIIVPENSKSNHALCLDLGHITITNQLVELNLKNEQGQYAVIDCMDLRLSDFKLSRIQLNEQHNIMKDNIILQPITFDVSIKRNLSSTWYMAVPDVHIFGQIDKIEVVFSHTDYRMIMSIVDGNMAEGMKPAAETMEEIKAIPSKSISIQRSSIIAATTTTTDISRKDHVDHVHILVKFNFVMNSFLVRLYTIDNADCYSFDTEKTGLASFALEGFSVMGRILTDKTINTSVLLVDCVLEDVRPGREGKLRRLFARKSDETESDMKRPSSSHKSMIDVVVKLKDNDMFVDFKISSFMMILSMEFLTQIQNFFTFDITEEEEELAKLMKPTKIQMSKSHVVLVEENPQNKQITVNVKVEKPDIILVEHMHDINTNALILNCEMLFKLRMSGNHQVINGTIGDIMMYTCCYNILRRAETSGTVLHPFSISIAGSTPTDEGLHIEVSLTSIHLCISPTIIELLNRAYITMYGIDEMEEESVEDIYEDHSELWLEKSFVDSDFWFLKTEVATEADESIGSLEMVSAPLKEMCIMEVPRIVVTIEAGVGNKTLPMLLLESHFQGKMKNWSSELSIEAVVTLQMGYYNSALAVWEPLIEPILEEVESKIVRNPWELKLEATVNNAKNVSVQMSEESGEKPQIQPKMSIDFSSTTNLEITVTKAALEVMSNLGKAFTEAVNATGLPRNLVAAPYRCSNDVGIPVSLSLSKSAFQVVGNAEAMDVLLESGASVSLQLKSEMISNTSITLEHEMHSYSNLANRVLYVQVIEMNCEMELFVVRTDRRYFSLNHRGDSNDNWGIISSVHVDNGVMIITLSSILKVHNHFNIPVDVYYMTERGNELDCIGTVEPDCFFNVPVKAVYTPTNELFFSVSNFSVTSVPFIWKDLQTRLSSTQLLQSLPKTDVDSEPFIIKAVGEIAQVYHENTTKHTMASTMYNVHLYPAIMLRNSLPIDIIVCVQNMVEQTVIKPSDTCIVPYVNPGSSYIVIRLPEYLENEWSCKRDIVLNPPQLSVWTFESYGGLIKLSLDLGMHVQTKDGSCVMSLYCPFWMLNKTELNLSYRKSRKTEKNEASGSPNKNTDENLNILHHPPNFKGPVLFSFNAKNFFGKKKASVRIANGEWSDKFSIDVAGSSGVVTCMFDDKIYQLGVHIQLTYNGLTKQVTFTPYYVIINSAYFAIECQEYDRPADPWTHIEPNSCTSLWPKGEYEDKLLKLRVVGTGEISASFLITESHITLLKLKNKYGGVTVDIQITEGAIYICLTNYTDGMAPALIINHTRNTLNIWEKDTVHLRNLEPNHKFYYTWDNPSGQRVLVWEGGYKKEIEDDLRKDGTGEYKIAENNYVFWISFLDGLQRVLLFTCDKSVILEAAAAKEMDKIDQEVNVGLHGLGLSLVNNLNRKEILYMGIASSGIIWETSKPDSIRYKQMSVKDSTMMEIAYQQFLIRQNFSEEEDVGRMIVDAKTEVDFSMLEMYRPHRRKIRRTFCTGLWLEIKTNSNLLQLHAKINRLQIDNQIYDCTFPVALAPVPPPKSVAGTDIHKPFAELSIVQLLIKHSQVKQFKYFKLLIQEFHVKLDLGFLSAILDLMQLSSEDIEEEKQKFLLDMELVNEPLYAHVSSQSLQEQKSFYDLLHFSPLKIHLSFSMATGAAAQGQGAPNFLNVLLEGLGVTLTDLQDVVFKLAYFERDYSFLTQKQLLSEVSTHYVGQAVKQLYVLVLGLDVLGNPYGLVLGITKGVEDLFYEPFQGAIQGPSEFAEGLALGVRSLFGHTIGGAAGAVSRITGAMGKGIAALTFDKDYQRKRRDQMNKKPGTVQEGIARSGKGLVMGVYDGVTGVFRKPISGAKEEGVGGFIKGLGKGAVGLVTRPTAGVMDFASSSLNTVKRVTEMSAEEARRLRPPRFIQASGLVTPYNRKESLGQKLLSELDKGKYANTDIYIYHFIVIAKKEALLLTNKRLAYVTHNDIFGGWQLEWSYTWQELSNPPKIVSKGVSITVSESRKKKKGLFGTPDAGRIILINDANACEDICNRIKELQNTA